MAMVTSSYRMIKAYYNEFTRHIGDHHNMLVAVASGHLICHLLMKVKCRDKIVQPSADID